MLVLSRKPQEKIQVGDVLITVILAQSGRVKLGIDAPSDVPIRRLKATDSVVEVVPKSVLQEA